MSSRSGIYKIVCTAHGKTYVGSAVNLKKRWSEHIRDLNVGKHRKPAMMSQEAVLAASQRMTGRVWTQDEIQRRVATRKATMATQAAPEK
jgi:predicted GIY-YIG superfamily endonuclease